MSTWRKRRNEDERGEGRRRVGEGVGVGEVSEECTMYDVRADDLYQ